MININSISKEYVMGDNKLLALNNVDVSINEGEFVSIMGSSGSGKSTLMNIIGCLDVPSNGDYFFRDNNISNYSSNKLAELRNKDIGFIFQNFNLLPRLNALEEPPTETIAAESIPPVQDSAIETFIFFLINLFTTFMLRDFIYLSTKKEKY